MCINLTQHCAVYPYISIDVGRGHRVLMPSKSYASCALKVEICKSSCPFGGTGDTCTRKHCGCCHIEKGLNQAGLAAGGAATLRACGTVFGPLGPDQERVPVSTQQLSSSLQVCVRYLPRLYLDIHVRCSAGGEGGGWGGAWSGQPGSHLP